MTSEKEMVIVSETHWDREWYLPFQEFRAKLVILVDKLLTILKNNPKFTNFTFDGQTIVIEDYLEVKPENKALLREYITEKRISVGPWYVLPDEFLVSGEALIRNLMLGHKIARSFGRVMRAGYIPDPFGHIAQLPQILQGFDIDSVIFMRGMDDSEEKLGLNLEFNWYAPGRVASVLAIHLRYGYGSVAELPTQKTGKVFKAALMRIRKLQRKMLQKSATTILLLNNGSDHNEVQAELPEIIEDWNNTPELNEYKLVQNDFEYYINKLKQQNLNLKDYEGELRGSRYHPILSGVFSARMWIKQLNTECQFLYESWAEPFATFAWLLGQPYPQNYLWTGWKWLLRNHPHDSICGCSIDEVHQDMQIRFRWAKQIAQEITKDAMYAIFNRIQLQASEQGSIPFIVFNSLPWARTDIAYIDITVPQKPTEEYTFHYRLFDSSNRSIPFQIKQIEESPRITVPNAKTYRVSFLTEELPACGYEVYRFIPYEEFPTMEPSTSQNSIENEFYKVAIHKNGTFSILDKELQKLYDNLGIIEDRGDWGDEYDYSPPVDPNSDLEITNKDIDAIISVVEQGPVKSTVQIKYHLSVPASLSPDRSKRSKHFVSLPIVTYITLYSGIKRIDLKIEVDNQAKDHRLRILFPTGIISEKVYVDGHFMVVDRPVKLPEGLKWKQPPSKTNHQQKFISIEDENGGITIINRGLPEYEAIKESDGTITIAITLLRCIGWLALPYLVTRKEIAGPSFSTPEAQCIGKHIFELAIVTHKEGYLKAGSFKKAFEFNIPLRAFNPAVMRTALRIPDHIFFRGLPLLLPADYFSEKYLPEKLSFLKIEPAYLVLSACKKAEQDEAFILRIYNLASTSSKGKVMLFREIQDVEIVNLDEQKIQDPHITNLQFNKNQLTFQISGFKIGTFKIKLK